VRPVLLAAPDIRSVGLAWHSLGLAWSGARLGLSLVQNILPMSNRMTTFP
jgi:hypothetical protein